jgi:hypothetical protein
MPDMVLKYAVIAKSELEKMAEACVVILGL